MVSPEINVAHTILILMSVLLVSVVLLASVGYIYFIYSPSPQKPAWNNRIQHATIKVRNLERSYLLYTPENLTQNPPLVLVFHGSGGDGEKMRKHTSYEFERLANANGFVVVYPDGYEGNWNDSRVAAPYPAKKLNIDDKGFVVALIQKLKKDIGINDGRVFAVGLSNGGHMSYRLGLEMPGHFAGIAAISANLPTKDNSDCQVAGKPIPTLIIQGIDDPLNPYQGGRVNFLGIGDRGTVLSTLESAQYFARLNGHNEAPKTTNLPHLNSSDDAPAEQMEWTAPGKGDVLLIVHGGGHVIPQAHYRFPRIMGRTSQDFNGPAEIWNFFARQPERKQQST